MYCTDIMVDDVEQHTLGQPKRVTVHLVVAVLQKGYGAFYGQRACRWSSPLHFVMANAPKPCSGRQFLHARGAIEWATHCQASWGMEDRGEIIMATMNADVFGN